LSRLSRELAKCLIIVSALFGLPTVVHSDEPITLNFKDAEIDSVIGAFGHLLNRTFVIDPRVRGKMSLETPRPVTKELAFTLLKTVLRQQGFAVVDIGTLVKVVPEADAKLQSGPVETSRVMTRTGDEIVTQIFQLNHESATNMIPVLRPLVSPNNTITAFPNNNSLVITDYAANVTRLARIIANLDNPRAGNDVQVVQVNNSIATDVAIAVSRLLDDTARGGNAPGAAVDPGQRVTVLSDPRTNTVLLRTSSPAKMRLAQSLILQLDQPASGEQANMRVVYLRNAEAIKLVEVLRAVLSGDQSTSTSGSGLTAGRNNQNQQQSGLLSATGQGGAQGGMNASLQPLQQQGGAAGQQGTVAIVAGGAIIAADASTNSLIITAPEPVYRNIRTVIDKLDSRRAQVYIESLIVEVSADKAAELGIQWQFLNPSSSGNSVIGGTNLPARGTGSNILDVTTGIASIGTGLNVGLVRSGVSILGSDNIINLGVLARALETEAGANIKATPNLLTLDNEEARIIIGQNVPFITGQYTGTAGAIANPFQTIERKDVGTTLRVRPQVSEGGAVKMQIFQEVSSVQDASLAAGLITNRRAIESNVLVDDGQIVVLGGLIQDSVEGNVSKVPLLGDIPGFGRLFRYDSRKRSKTNLLVFLRPIVIRDAGNAWDVTANRYDYIRSKSANTQLPNLPPLPDYKMPDMQDLPPRPGTPGAPTPSRSPASLAPGLAEIFGSDRVAPPAQSPNSLSRPQPDVPGALPMPPPAAAPRPPERTAPRYTAPGGES
jgi:general secretion pathway protein D